MKLKKIILFILIFLFFLLLSSNVSAFVVSDSGVEKYYLPDLPNFSESNNYIMFFNESKSQVTLFSFPKTDYLGYDRINNRFTLFNSDKNIRPNEEVSMFEIYYCNVTLNVDKYICGGNWNKYSYVSTSVTLATIDYTNFKFIYGTTNIYPCYNDMLVTTLPFGHKWDEDLIIGYDISDAKNLVCIIPETQFNNYVWSQVDNNNNYCKYRENYNSSDFITLNCYEYNFNSNEWDLGSSGNATNCWPTTFLSYNEFIYFNKDILKYKDGSIIYKGMKDFFCGFYTYSTFPYILNSAEDLSKGEEDIIIMPR